MLRRRRVSARVGQRFLSGLGIVLVVLLSDQRSTAAVAAPAPLLEFSGPDSVAVGEPRLS